jgi:YVTN family beta-propeller protein
MQTTLTRLLTPVALIAGCGGSSSAPRKAYIGLFGDNAVAVVDTINATVLTTIPVSAPDGLVITPDGAKSYVSSNNSGVVDVIDTATDALTTSIAVGTQPAGLSITHDGRSVLVSVQGDGQAAVIDTATDAVIGKTAVGKAHNSAISADGTTAYVASQVSTAPALDLVALPGATAGATYSLDKAPRAVAVAAGKIYVTVAGSDAIEVLDAASGQVGTPITTGGSPHDIRPTIDGARVLTVSQTAGDLELVDPGSQSVIAHIPSGKMPHWIALSSDGAFAYVTDEGDNNMVIVDLAARSVTQTIAVGTAPRKIAVQP